MKVFLMDFGVVICTDDNKEYQLIRYFENRRIFSIVSKFNKNDNSRLYVLGKQFVDSKSNKKIRYWRNKFNAKLYGIIDNPFEIYDILNCIPKKYDKFIYYADNE